MDTYVNQDQHNGLKLSHPHLLSYYYLHKHNDLKAIKDLIDRLFLLYLVANLATKDLRLDSQGSGVHRQSMPF